MGLQTDAAHARLSPTLGALRALVLMNIPTIETDRLRLRAFEPGDLGPYAEIYADDVFGRYLGGKTLTRRQVWENIAIILGHWALLGYGMALGQLNA